MYRSTYRIDSSFFNINFDTIDNFFAYSLRIHETVIVYVLRRPLVSSTFNSLSNLTLDLLSITSCDKIASCKGTPHN